MLEPPEAAVIMTPAAMQLHDAQSILAPGRTAPLDLTIFVSCFNEAPYIVDTIDTVRAALAELGRLSFEIIVVDDCSSDGSPEIVADYIRAHPDDRILLRRNQVNRGLAQNYLDAAFIGKGKYYRLACGDNAEPQDTMVAVFGAIGQADLVIPYYADSQGRSFGRLLLSQAYTSLVNFIGGFRLKYYNGLAVHLRHNVMRWHSNTRGFGFQAAIICLLLDQGFSYLEIPVRTVERRRAEKSHALTPRNIVSVLHTLIDLVLRRVSRWIY
jgi:glycosyltransferase involved in cell wall biosynthesis